MSMLNLSFPALCLSVLSPPDGLQGNVVSPKDNQWPIGIPGLKALRVFVCHDEFH